MRIIPVLDLREGQVVRGVGGRRHEYRPIESGLTSSHEPLHVARAFRVHFAFDELYLADLDAIEGRPPALATFRALLADGFHLWVDAGIRQAADGARLADVGIQTIVAGLETVAGPAMLMELIRTYSPGRIVFSLDLKRGLPLHTDEAWARATPAEIARLAWRCGIRRLLVLDLAHVGAGAGTGTEDLCRQLRTEFPELELTAGGGVRGLDDLQRLRAVGVDAVLVASALHDGRIDIDTVARLRHAAK